jgi:transposase
MFQVNKLQRAAAMSLNEIVALLDQEETFMASQKHLEEKLAAAQVRIDWLNRQLFGTRSERRSHGVLSQSDQLFLGEQMLDTPEDPPESTTTVAEHERKQRKRPTRLQESDSRLRFDDTVPVETIETVNPEVAGIPLEQLVKVGQKETYRLAQRPASYVVLKYVQTTYRVKETDQVLSAPVPDAIFNRSYADVSLLAGMVVDKFQFHLPLHRQHQRMQAGGLHVTRPTLTRLVRRAGELLEPVYATLMSSVLQSEVLAADESPTRAGTGHGKMKKGFFWVFFGDKEEVVFLFSPSRGRNVLDEFLKGFQGTLLSDGYIAYESFAKSTLGITPAQCWAHVRRN